ncbi:acetyltransferase [Planctomycetota bacterium]|nr:acetyltransferase [Planctomycetota bacterium]
MTAHEDPALLADLQQLHGFLAERMQGRWQRDLPLNELVGDRWQRASRLGFGEGASIYDSACVFGQVAVGAHTWIGPFTVLDGSGGLRIGHHCSISSGVMIFSHDTVAWAVSGGRQPAARAPVAIGDRCYIGSQTVIAKGVTIGDGCVIGACSFVNRDLPSGSLAYGSPARISGRVELSGNGEVRLVHHLPDPSGDRSGTGP